MKHIGKRVLSMLCALVILLSMAGMIVPGTQATENTIANEIDAIPSAHLVSMRDHSTFATDASQGTTYVDDADAYGGKAVCYAKTPLNSSSFITVKRYDNNKELTIGNLPLESLKVNDGYQVYQFTYAVPADATEGGVFFIMNNWQLNSKEFCADFAPYAGKTVEVYVSLKVTGPADDGNYSVYVDRVALATVCEDYLGEDGATCTLCGEGDKLLSMIPGEHLVSMRDHSTFATDANSGTTYVDDADAYGGKAVCYAKTPLNSSSFITIKRYDNNKELTIGNLPLASLKVNAGYQVYQFTYDVPADATEGGVFFIMNNWQLNSKEFCADFAPYAGKTVEVYVSLKVTGPADDGNYSVYVDRVALATVCADYPNEDGSACTQCGKLLSDGTHAHNCTQYTYVDAQKHTGTCSSCGEVLTEKHTWNSGVITVAPTIETEGEKTYTCTVCEGTKTEVLDMLQEVKLPLVFRANDLTLPYSADSVVEDADSQYGKAAMLSYTARNATGSEGLVNAMIFGSGEQLKLFTYDGTNSVLVGAITVEELQANAAAGQYATYTFEAVELVPTGSNVYLYMFDCWGLKTQFTNEQLSLLEGKLLDVTVSMKVTGDVTGAGASPTYYIDSITFASAEPNEINSIPSEHRVSVRDYSTFATDATNGTTYVDDAEAHNGKAVCYAKTPLDASNFISIKRYDNDKELTIGNLPLENLKVNEGYQIYKFTYDVPADATEGGVFFIMNNWQLNNAQFSKDFAPYAGQTVEVYLSMKVTGPSNDGYYSVCVDRVALATVCQDYASDDGVYCTLCGKYLQAEEGKYALVVIGPSGTVYPYQDSVKEYLLDENLDILSHYEAGTKEFGDASIAPVCIKWTDSDDSTITRYVVEYATKKDYSDAIVVEKDALLGEKEIEVYNLYKASTYYVRITAYAEDTVLGQTESTFQTTDLGPRFMSIDGLYNVRDLGGYKTADGKITVQGMIYRGSEGDGENGILITQAGNDYMSNVLNIKTDMDLRGSTTESPISSATKLPFRVWGYEDAFSQTELHRALFASFADINNYPVYIHCHAGADRTGTICYLLNALLGVSEEDLIRDYEITSYSIFGERVKDNSIYPFADFVDRLKTYEGDTLQEKTENYMLSIGVTEDEIRSIREIMLEEPQTHTHTCTDYTYVDEDQHTGVCSGCGETLTENHTWDNGVVTLEPTTEATGEKTYTCTVCNGTKTEELDKLKVETEFVPSEHLLVMRDHSAFATDANEGTTYVDDADAYGGKAVCYAKTKLDASSFITIKRYDNGEERTIGNLPLENLKVNEGYQVYKFTYDVPADATDGGVFFIMNNWQLNSALFSKDFAPYAGQTVEVYLSIKIAGPFSDGYYSVSVDRVALASVCQWDDGVVTVKPTTEAEGEKTYTCTVCNATKTEVLDKLGAENVFVPNGHLLVMRDYSCFATDTNEGTVYVDDTNAYGGKAVSYTKAKLNDSNFIAIKRYDNGEERTIGNLPLESLKVNAGYQVYKFTYDVPADTTEGGVFFIMNNWQLNSAQFCKDFAAYAGKTVDVYLSIKVAGPSSDGSYSVSVDRVALASVCQWDAGVVTLKPTAEAEGVKTYTCTVCNATKTEVLDKLGAENVFVPSEHLLVMRDYSCFATDANEGTVYVDDPDAYGDKAVCYSKTKLDDSSFISINRYDVASGLADGDPKLKIGGLALGELEVNAGYQVYRFTYDVPAETTAGNVFYIMNNWQLNSAQFCKDFAAYAGKTVDVYLSMKVTGPSKDGYYCVYVDRVALASVCKDYASKDGTVCTLCGKSLLEEEEPLSMIFLAEDFKLPYAPTDSVVKDPKSQYGKAAKFSYALRNATGDAGLINAMNFGGEETLNLCTYDGTDVKTVGSISIKQLQKNASTGKYATYKFRNVKLVPAEGDIFMLMFDCWGLQVRFTYNQLNEMRGKLLDVTVSMRVTGDVLSTTNPPTYYIDYIQITDASGEGCSHDYSEWTFVDLNEHSRECYACGYIQRQAHSWDDGVAVEGASEDQVLFSCTKCDGFKPGGDVYAFFTADNITLPYAPTDYVVEDPDSLYGKAVAISYAARYATGDQGLYNVTIFQPGAVLTLYTCNGREGKPVGSITSEELQANAAAGKYVTYRISNVDMTGVSFVYLFNCWGLQARFTEEQLNAMQGKLVDVLVSMKVTGDVTSTDDPPIYYIDSITFTPAVEAEEEHTHTFTDYTAIDENQHTCTCSECGEVLTEDHTWNAGEVVQKATTEKAGERLYTCTACGATKSEIIDKLTEEAQPPVEDGGFISKDIFLWAILVGVADLAVIIFIIIMIKKTKKK